MKAGRILVILLLVGVLAGVAYVRALYSRQDRDGSRNASDIRQGNEKGRSDAFSRTADSLRLFYIDSLTTALPPSPSVDPQLQATADSLGAANETLREQLEKAQREAEAAEQTWKSKYDQLILAFYQGEVTALPSDLSEYERSVSIREIKSKAEMYFGISTKALERIIGKRK
jgi:hypothetical protein